MNITDLEAIVLKSIAENDYTPLNGAVPSSANDCTTWVNCIMASKYDCPTGKSLSGVMSSLYQKKLTWTDGEVVGLTDEGFEEYKKL